MSRLSCSPWLERRGSSFCAVSRCFGTASRTLLFAVLIPTFLFFGLRPTDAANISFVGSTTSYLWTTAAGSPNWSSTNPPALNWIDSAAGAWNGASATNYNNNDNVTFYDNNGTSFPANFAIRTSSAGVSPGSVTFTHVANEASGSSKVFTFTDISGAVGIAGSGGLTLTNSFAGTVDLAGGNTFTGATVVNAGTLELEDPRALMNSSGLSLANNTVLHLKNATSANFTINNLTPSGNVTVQIDFTAIAGGNDFIAGGVAINTDNTTLTLQSAGGTSTSFGLIIADSVALNAAGTTFAAMAHGQYGGSFIMGGQITGSQGFTIAGGAITPTTVVLANSAGNNNFAGGITIDDQAHLQIAGGTAAAQISATADLNVMGVVDFDENFGVSNGKVEHAHNVTVSGANADFNVTGGATFVVNSITSSSAGAGIHLSGDSATPRIPCLERSRSSMI